MKRFEAFEDMEDRWRWRLIAASGKIIASSGERFDTHADAVRAAARVSSEAAGAAVSREPGIGFKALLGRLIRREEDRRSRALASKRARPSRRRTIGAAPEPNRIRAPWATPTGSRH